MAAKAFKKRLDFYYGSSSAYQIAAKNKWLDEICSHMKPKIHEYTFEECRLAALKYEYKKDFREKEPGKYRRSIRKKWLHLICCHQKPVGDLMHRMVYAYEFEDKCVYVGLTYNSKERYDTHLSTRENPKAKSPVKRHIEETDLVPTYKELTEYTEAIDAQRIEGETVKEYKNNGWNILNKAKTGGLGGGETIWTKEKCEEEALKYVSLKEFRKTGAYNKILEKGWLDELCSHLIRIIKKRGYWSKEKCLSESIKYKTCKEFRDKEKTAYKVCCQNNWIDEACSHMIKSRREQGHWDNKDACLQEFLKYDNVSEFYKKSQSCYNAIKRNNWFDDICINKTNKL